VRDESGLRGIDRRLGRVEHGINDLGRARETDLRLFEALRETQIEQSKALEDVDKVVGGIAIAVQDHTRTLRDHTDMLTAQGEKLASLEVTVVDFRAEVKTRFESVDSRLDSVDGKLSQVIDLLGGLE